MICKYCGNDIEDGASFCQYCGRKIEYIKRDAAEDINIIDLLDINKKKQLLNAELNILKKHFPDNKYQIGRLANEIYELDKYKLDEPRKVKVNYSLAVASSKGNDKNEYYDILFENKLIFPSVITKRLFISDKKVNEVEIVLCIKNNSDEYYRALKKINISNNIRGQYLELRFYLISGTEGIIRIFDNDDCIHEEKIAISITNNNETIIDKEFHDVVGMNDIKRQLEKFYTQLRFEREIKGTSDDKSYNFILLGNPGTGKTMISRAISKIMFSMGLIKSPEVIEVDRSHLVGGYIGQTAPKTKAILDEALKTGKTLFIDEAYQLYVKNSDNDFGNEAITTILKHMEDNRGKYSVIMAGYEKEMNDMLDNANPGFRSRFTNVFTIEDYSDDELVQIADGIARKKGFYLTERAKFELKDIISRERVSPSFANARTSRSIIEKACENCASRFFSNTSLNYAERFLIIPEDLGVTAERMEEKTIDEYLSELKGLIGLNTVKEQVESVVNSIRVSEEMKKRGISYTQVRGSMNMIFQGNPGTGKTTVARILANIYKKLGILKRGSVVEVSERDLIGRYVGETPLKTSEVIKKAIGGILFIDEAYTLNKDSGSGANYGKEAIEVILKAMEDYREDLIVIVAGYADEMSKFIGSNPGLESRFSIKINFEDYTSLELVEIFKVYVENAKKILVDISDDDIDRLIQIKKSKVSQFGNARGVRNVFEELCKIAENRVAVMLSEGKNVEDRDFFIINREDLLICQAR